jgi:ABC-type polysaccharide/polyol phosphate export permease
MFDSLRELFKFRELLYMFTLRQIQIKYKQSFMGLLWAFLMPMIIVFAGVLVKLAFAIMSQKPFETSQIATVAVKSVPWAFFVSAIRFASQSLIANANLVTKIYFPREICPLSAALSQMVDFAVASVLLIAGLCFIGVGFSVYQLLVPVYILLLFLLTAGLGIVLSAASLFFRDVKYIVEVILTFAIFFTPVFYEHTIFGERGQWLLLNPVAPILEGLNDCIVMHRLPDMGWFGYCCGVTLLVTLFSLRFFKKLEPAFAESI